VASSKRERELARAKYERQRARKASQAARRRRRNQVVTAAVVAVLVVVGFATLSKVLGGSSPAAAGSSTPRVASCTYVTSGAAPAARKVTVPPSSAPTSPATKPATLVINHLPVQVSLLTAKAPCTVNSFVHLAQAGFYTNTPCHRITLGAEAILQCGDPSGTGQGGPGYSYDDENLTGATYPAGTVAMANNGANTNGSQFFIVYANTTLPASYTPFGRVTNGLAVIQAIAKNGVKGGGSDGSPAKPVTLNTVTIGS
jgi:peptidyl-prolyl cis-trans isomerase B (cyclophilin B)